MNVTSAELSPRICRLLVLPRHGFKPAASLSAVPLCRHMLRDYRLVPDGALVHDSADQQGTTAAAANPSLNSDDSHAVGGFGFTRHCQCRLSDISGREPIVLVSQGVWATIQTERSLKGERSPGRRRMLLRHR